MQITNARQAKTLSPAHMKQCILAETRFDFLKDLVKNLPDATQSEEEPHHNNHAASSVQMQAIPLRAVPTTYAPRTSTLDVANLSKDGSSYKQTPPRRQSADKGDNSKIAKPAEGNETVFSYSVPKVKTSVPTTFNASQPNFYTEVNSNPSDNSPRSSSQSQPVSNYTLTANIDEDYDT